MVSMKEQLPCRVSWRNRYKRLLSRNSISRYAGVCGESERESECVWTERERERERESVCVCVVGEREFGGPGRNNRKISLFSKLLHEEEEV